MSNPHAWVKVYHDALNAFDFQTVERCFAEDVEYHSPGINGALHGRTEIMAAFQNYFAEYPDQIAVDDEIEIVAPLKVKTLWRLEATSVLTKKFVSRRGSEEITFNERGHIKRVVVVDL